MARIPGFHPGGPGSIPGVGVHIFVESLKFCKNSVKLKGTKYTANRAMIRRNKVKNNEKEGGKLRREVDKFVSKRTKGRISFLCTCKASQGVEDELEEESGSTKGPIDCQERRSIVPSKPPMRSQDKTTTHNAFTLPLLFFSHKPKKVIIVLHSMSFCGPGTCINCNSSPFVFRFYC